MASARRVCAWCKANAPKHLPGCGRYVPHEQQYRAHAAPEPVRLFAGGYGSGKTRALIQEAYDHATKATGTPFLMTSPTWKMMRRTLWRTLVDALPGATRWPTNKDKASEVLGPFVSDWSASTGVLRWWNGEELFFGSLQAPESIEGINAGAGGMDEPRLITKAGYELQLSRIGRQARATRRFLITGVPVIGWMDEIFGPLRCPDRTDKWPRMSGEYARIRCETEWNPFVPEDYAARLRSSMSERRARAFLEGRFVHFDGVVYETYDPIPHEVGDIGSVLSLEPDPLMYTYAGLDFGYQRPAFVVVQRRDIGGGQEPVDVVVLQVVASGVDEETHARMCAQELQRHGLVLDACWCDSQGAALTVPERHAPHQLPAVETYRRVFKEAGVLKPYGLSWHSTPVCRLKTNRIEVVRQRFRGWDGRRRLFVARRVVEYDQRRSEDGASGQAPGLHASLTNYRYMDGEGREKPDKGKGYSDFCDALEFAVVGEHGVFGAGPGGNPSPTRGNFGEMADAFNDDLERGDWGSWD